MKRSASLSISFGVVAVAMLLGIYTVVGVLPERLRGEAELWLEETTGGPVDFRELRLVVGFPMHLEVGGLVALGDSLRVERISLRFSVVSLLTGEPRTSRVVVEGAEVDLPVGPGGILDASDLPGPGAEGEFIDAEVLFASFENTLGELLAGPAFADSIELRESRIDFVPTQPGSPAPAFRLDALTGHFQRSRLRGVTQVWLSAGLRIGSAVPSRVELTGSRARDGGVRLSLVTSGLELGALSDRLGTGSELWGFAGQLEGVVKFSSPAPSSSTLSLDVVLRDPLLPDRVLGQALGVDRLLVRGLVGVDRDGLREAFLDVLGERLELRLSAPAPGPLNADTPLDFAFKVAGLEVSAIRGLWERVVGDEEVALRTSLDSVEGGRVEVLDARARYSLGDWTRLVTEGTVERPRDLQIATKVEGLDVVLPDERRLQRVDGRLEWDPDRLHVQLDRAFLEGVRLPAADLEVAGFTHFFTADAAMRSLRPGSVPIPGAELLRELLEPEGETGPGPRVALEVDFLHHPALLWPLEAAEMSLEVGQDASEIRVSTARWGGVPLRARATLPHAEAGRLRLRVDAESPSEHADAESGEIVEGIWARGRFDMGPLDLPDWQQRDARASFEIHEGELRLEEVEIGLTPRGELHGGARFDLRTADALPCEVDLRVIDGQTESLLWLMGLDRRTASGTLNISGSLIGEVTRELPLFAGLDGELLLRAHEGSIDQSLPPLVALALASQTFDTFRRSDSLRYDEWETTLSFRDGRVSTEGFELDGPDLRLFAAGGIDLLREPHLLEAEIAVFLFRQLDRALGEIPILNWVLMGRNENLLAAFFELEGPWNEPEARALPLRTLSEGPAGDMILAIPDVMQRGLRALSALLGAEPDPEVDSSDSFSGGGES